MLIFIVNKQLDKVFEWAQLNHKTMYVQNYGEWVLELEDDDPTISLLLLQFEPGTLLPLA